jgi:hypothetical protein
LFAPVDAAVVAWFRVSLALFLGYALWPRGLAPSRWVDPSLQGLYASIVSSTPYLVALYALILLFALGWRARLTGLLLFALILPLAFFEKGRVSRQLLASVVLFLSFYRTVPAWRWRELKNFEAGPMWPIRLVQLQVSVLYGVNAFTKSTPEYLSGEVLMTLSVTQPNFLVDLSTGYLTIGTLGIPVFLLAWATVAIEYTLGLGFWLSRWRMAVALLGVGFHLVLKWVVRIFMLDYTAVFLYLAFLLPFDRNSKVALVRGESRPGWPPD